MGAGSSSSSAGAVAADGQDAYDSGEEVAATAEDNAFIDSEVRSPPPLHTSGTWLPAHAAHSVGA